MSKLIIDLDQFESNVKVDVYRNNIIASTQGGDKVFELKTFGYWDPLKVDLETDKKVSDGTMEIKRI